MEVSVVVAPAVVKFMEEGITFLALIEPAPPSVRLPPPVNVAARVLPPNHLKDELVVFTELQSVFALVPNA